MSATSFGHVWQDLQIGVRRDLFFVRIGGRRRQTIKTAIVEIDDLNERLTESEPFDLKVDTAG
jgi:hypothetical protein